MEFLKRFTGPEIYVVINEGIVRPYQANLAESLGGRVTSFMKSCMRIGTYLSPLILIYCYRYGLSQSFQTVQKFGPWLVFIYGVAFLVRGLGRNFNKHYADFSVILAKAEAGKNKDLLRRYDFEFDHWPVDYQWSSENTKRRHHIANGYAMNDLDSSLPVAIRKHLAIIVASTVGRRLVYPGTLWIIQSSVWPQLLTGRSRLVSEFRGQRHKLVSACNDTIDTMFIDRRNDPNFPRGNVLMITCEGNAGFYEVGVLSTALEAGYSVLGWNHPGFAGSTGEPWPMNDCAAIDVVMQFASKRLGFPPHETVIVAWSIGGFSATWLGMNYPDLRGMILDAVFDDVLHLARHAMPAALETIVRDVIKTHFNLHIADQIKAYNGPVSFIRRSHEEIIVTDTSSPQNQRRSNRINFLLQSFLQYRYPHIFTEKNREQVFNWIAKASQDRAIDSVGKYNSEECVNLLTNYFGQPNQTVSFPSEFGLDFNENVKAALAYYLVNFYFSDFDATHCAPLAASYLKIPYHPWDVILNN